ncbi:MAG: 50S ribosomal protein L1 [Coxiellaceae bacterium]|nr:MAG: 50S ribosomal protein L1 [Coxiellaceae bacterium]
MPKISKRQKFINERVQPGKMYSIDEAINIIKECAKKPSSRKLTESFDVSINLGIDARKSEQAIRGATLMPHGTGKTVRIAVFAQGEQANKAKAAGADIVGLEDLADSVKAGQIDFDVVIATPDSMRIVGQLGQILGPRGLMPNPKVGTVTADTATAVKNAKGGQVRFRTDKAGIVHCAIGKVDFEAKALKENLEALLIDVKKAKPSASKGVYLKKITVSSTMGPGIVIDQASLPV